MTYQKIELDPFPPGTLITTVTGKDDKNTRILHLEGDGVLLATTSEKDLLKENEGVVVVFTGEERLLSYLVNAMMSWMVLEGLLAGAIHHLILKHGAAYQKAQIEAIALNLTEEPHDRTEGRTRPAPGGSTGGHGTGPQAEADGAEETP